MAKRQVLLSNFFQQGDIDGDNGHGQSGPKRLKKIIKNTKRGSGFGSCPICQVSFSVHILEEHASSCTGKVVRKNDIPSSLHFPLACSDHLPGLYVIEDFISIEEESLILSAIKDNVKENSPRWTESTFNGKHLGKRWGVHCNLRLRKVTSATHEMPSFFRDIIFPKLLCLKQMNGIRPNEANAIDYRKSLGHYLVSHVDNRQLSKEPIANLSLAGSCNMTFTPVSQKWGSKAIKVLLKPRTLQILTGPARYSYSHGIEHHELLSERRVSITMRESPLSNC